MQIEVYFFNRYCKTAGSDYDAVSETLTFGEGNIIQCVRINITDDSCVEPNQTFSVDIVNLQNSPPSITLGPDISADVTILDDGKFISYLNDVVIQ